MKMTLDPWATTSRMRSNRNCSSSSGRNTVGSSSTSTDVGRAGALAVLTQLLGRPGDRDERLADGREFVDDRPRIDRDAVRLEHRARLGGLGPPVDAEA